MEKKYEVLKTKRVELGRFAIRLDTIKEGGNKYPYSFIEAKDSVAVLAESDGKFILVRQYRHSIGTYVTELPGGSMEDREDPKEAAVRELLEETGYTTSYIHPLGSFYPTAGSSNERCHLFYVKCGEKTEQNLEPLEYLTVELADTEEMEKRIKSGEFVQSMMLVTWLKYKLNRYGQVGVTC